jgi:hypothetical protein
MGFWTSLRDTVESAAVIAGNVVLPGSSLVTSKLVSDGSQKQLNSTVGQLAQLGSGGYGALEGNLANYGTAYDKVASVFGGGAGSEVTGQQAVDAFNAGKISPAEFEAIAQGAGTTSAGLLAGGAATLSKYLTPAAILGSSLVGANAASKAADTQAAAQSQANQLVYSMFQQQQAAQEPWRQAGLNALNKLQSTAGNAPGAFAFNNNAIYRDPGYAFRLSEGQKALENQAAARGGLISGNALRAATTYGQNMGSQEYQNAYNRALTGYNTGVAQNNTLYNRQAALAGIGQTATNQMGANTSNYSNTAANGITDVARAQAAGYQGQANAFGGGVSQYLNYASNNSLLDAIRNKA